jgi:hypothetical protein
MSNLKLPVLSCILLAVTMAGQDYPPRPPTAAEPWSPIPASMIQLIATPQRFDGKLVLVDGFLAMAREYPALFLHREDLENALLSNAVWVDPTEQMGRDRDKINLRYVRLVGVFHAFRMGERGHNKIFGMSGGITDIKSCTLWSDPAHPRSRKWNDAAGQGSKPE